MIKYSYNDIMIKPATISEVSSRSECNPYIDGRLPLFTAPMDTVVGTENLRLYEENKITPIVPRTVDWQKRISLARKGYWIAVSLSEFEERYVTKKVGSKDNVLIDIANGHMLKLYDMVKSAKNTNPGITVMVGNIANPDTYRWIVQNCKTIHGGCCLIDYVRLGIGAGQGCITSSNTGIHYPMASLIEETAQIRQQLLSEKIEGSNWSKYNNLPKIVADGGVRGYSDVIKALALGADYVMIGSIFSKMLESSGELEYKLVLDNVDGNYYPCDKSSVQYSNRKFYINFDNELGEVRLRKKFYGMASKDSKLKGGKENTAEGISMYLPVEYTMASWTKNMADYIRSAMSYVGVRILSEFHPNTVICSYNAVGGINK